MDVYNKDNIGKALTGGLVSEVVLYDKISSTSDFARADEVGTLVIANEQSEGRGRLGRSFLSKKGGVYFSLTMSRDLPDGIMLTLAAAVAVAQAVQEVVKNPEDVKIKWVNDVFFKGKKVAGILAERLSDKIVLGIGVNFYPVDFGEFGKIAVSLFSTKNPSCTREALLISIIKKLDAQVKAGGFMEYYRQNSLVLGKEITYLQNGESKSGKVTAVSDEGHLILSNGEELSSGEISVRLL